MFSVPKFFSIFLFNIKSIPNKYLFSVFSEESRNLAFALFRWMLFFCKNNDKDEIRIYTSFLLCRKWEIGVDG